MDLKAISWVGNIYQKFETMCLEVEEAMYQDTVKYVENQAQTVGASVKRFYSEVMQDVNPQYDIDPVKVAAADLSLNPYAHHEIDKKLEAKLKGITRVFSNKLNDDTQVIKGKSKSGGVYKRQNVGIKEIARDSHPAKSDAVCLASGDATKLSSSAEVRGGFEMASGHVTRTMSSPLDSVKGSESGEAENKVCDHIIQANLSAIDISTDSASSITIDSVGQKQADPRNSTSVGGFLPDSSADTFAEELACNSRLEISTNAQSDEFAIEEIKESCEERSDNSSSVSKKYDIIESEVEVIEKFAEPELEETCVLVEGERIHIPQDPIRQKSYKKKLRKVFSTKMRSTRKEYERLGALYGDQQFNADAKDNMVMPALSMNSNTNKLSTNDHSEPEWEIL